MGSVIARRVEGLRADTVVRPDKHAVAAVGAAAYDEIGQHAAPVVAGAAEHDAAARIGIVRSRREMSYILILLPAPSEKNGAPAANAGSAQTIGNEPILPRDPENRICIFLNAPLSLCAFILSHLPAFVKSRRDGIINERFPGSPRIFVLFP